MNHTPPTPVYRAVTITPELAREWLKRNTRNRRLDTHKINVLAGAMERGEWIENGDAIRFGVSGALLDGQHRLAAVDKTRISIRALVVEDLTDEAQDTVDTGSKRSFAAVLQIKGIKDQAAVAGLARKIFDYEHEQLRNSGNPPTHAQLQVVVDNHESSIRESLRVAAAVRRHVPIPTQMLGLAHWLFNQIDEADCEYFFDRLRSGEGLLNGDPILVLRNAVRADAARGPRQQTYRRVHVLALLIKAWNFYRAGEQVPFLQWRQGGHAPEKFPVPE